MHFFVSTISAMDSGLVRKAKEILNYHAFGSDPVKGVSQDYNKPLFIPAYSDSMQAILGQSSDHGRITLDMWKHQYTTHFPQTVRFLYSAGFLFRVAHFSFYYLFDREMQSLAVLRM